MARTAVRPLPILASLLTIALATGGGAQGAPESAPPASSAAQPAPAAQNEQGAQAPQAQAAPNDETPQQRRQWGGRRVGRGPGSEAQSQEAAIIPSDSRAFRRPNIGGEEEMIPNIQFPNSDIHGVLSFYERLTGKELIYDNTVQGQINIVVTRPVTRDEATRIIETALMVNGFSLVPGPGTIIKVLGASKNPRQFAVPIISDLHDLPEGDQIVTFLFKLENADPSEVQQVLSQYVAASPYTVVIPLPKSQALMITETAGVIQMLSRVIGTLDKPPAEVVSEFITMQRADAADVVEKLNVIFEKQQQATTAAFVPRGLPQGGPGAPGGPGMPNFLPNPEFATRTAATLSEDSIIVGKIKLTADIRTNRIHVVTRPINIPFIRQLIAEYDSNVSFGEPSKRLLRFVSAGDMLDIIAETLKEPGVKEATGTGQNGASSRTSVTPPAQSNSGGSSGGNASSGGGSISSKLGGEELATEAIDTTPEARTIGNTRIIADKRSNAIIVLGNTEAKEKIFRLLDQIDVRTPQVMLTAVIGELSLDEGQEFGIDYIQTLGRNNNITTTGTTGTTLPARTGFAGIGRNTGVPIQDIAALTTAASLAGVPAGYTGFFGVTPSLEIIVHALESTGRFRITSRPMVFTSNNKKAIITSGQEIAVPSNITSGFTGSSNELVSTANVTYKDIVLKLEVVPLINSEREVTLDIVQEVNNVNGTTMISGNAIPNVSARRIKTTVSIANESTLVLGGLVQEETDVAKTGIPILSKIPVVGSLFSNQKKTSRRSELVILLRPTVTYGPDEAVDAGERATEKLHFPPDLESTLDPEGTLMNSNQQRVKTRQPAPKLRISPGL